MSFGNVVFTNKGRLLRTKAELGTTLEFTKIGIGKGIIDEQPVSELTDLIDSVLDVDITNLKTYTNGQARIGGVFINKGLSYGFYWRELGLFANDPDNGEILYCYGNAGDLAEYIPADGGSELLEKYVSIVALIGNASNVTATINSSLVYATMEQLESKVDKVEGKTLSTNDYTTEDKNKLAMVEERAQVNRAISDSISTDSSETAASSKAVKQVNDKVNNRVVKVSGKGLSTENYSSEEKNKLAGIEETAQVNREISDSIILASSSTVASSKAVKTLNDKVSESVADKMGKRGDTIESYSEKIVANSSTTGSVYLDLSIQNIFLYSLAGPTTLNFRNVADSGKFQSCLVRVKQGSTAYSVTFGNTIKWDNDEIPDLTEVNKVYTLTFYTIDGGTTFVGQLINTHSA
ncbi:tail fiber protein [Vallitalea guaymasensis]|uniref:tail fiber protein n=1 Tax=Vallitalea guaymasensis TaxID=1185412 RepID=UPI0023545879|nr:tail fiber protein [Vallitalea guaymasensis]